MRYDLILRSSHSMTSQQQLLCVHVFRHAGVCAGSVMCVCVFELCLSREIMLIASMKEA